MQFRQYQASLLLVLAACGEAEATRARNGVADAGMPIVEAIDGRRVGEVLPSSTAPVAPVQAVVSAQPSAFAEPAVSPPKRRCPVEMERIGGYCIDKWEGHLVSRGPGGEEVVHPRNIPPDPQISFEARSAPDVWPQGHISRTQADAACKASGKRMCAWIEWRRACQGSKWKRWPYGNELREGACNSGKDHLIMKMFGKDPNKWETKDFNDARLNHLPGFLAKTGAHPECVSPDGIYDMVGNLHEWVIDSVSSSFIRKMKEDGMPREKQPHALGNGMFLGGFYSTRSEHGMGCFFVTIAHSKKYFDYSTGFRCCKDASPPED